VISGAPVIVADFTATTFCDSAGLRRLILIHKRAAVRDIELRLAVTPGGAVARVIELMGVDRRLLVYPGVKEASRPADQAARQKCSSLGD
jgi:anti-anti-sigma regulatory factor